MAANELTTGEGGASRALTSGGFMHLAQSQGARNIALMLGASAVIAVMAGVFMWSQQPDYKVLFSNFSDKDGGAIVASLQQLNVPYKFAEGGGAILVPATQVHEARVKLASQGLPKGGGVGFELMENQKLGVSQFLEQVNFQRALEGELARSIQAIGAVSTARVHLALPKASVFVREQMKPTASVLLNLHAGRSMDQGQVDAVVHLVASSVPDLPAKNVTVVDQNGTLLSGSDRPNGGAPSLDPSQLKYIQELQQAIARRIESIVTPIVGPSNVRAEATADIDFSSSEQAAEIYKPNQGANANATVRSTQTSESQNSTGAANTAAGVPGALSNQPPGQTTAPINAPAASAPGAAANAAAAAAPAQPQSQQKDNTVNYEVDKTIRYEQKPMGGIRRLSVAVVVNYKREVDRSGKVGMRALTEGEKTQITDLVKEAMGYNKERGDTLNVVNSPFAGADKEALAEAPIWKRAETWQLAKEAGKYLIGLILLLWLFFGFLRPTVRKLTSALPAPPEEEHAESGTGHAQLEGEHPVPVLERPRRNYEENLQIARTKARSDPKMVANVVKGWVGE
jgi:flagellar M-ring protein FliF